MLCDERVSGEESQEEIKEDERGRRGGGRLCDVSQLFLSTRKNVLLITNRMFQNVMDAKKRDYHTVCVCT